MFVFVRILNINKDKVNFKKMARILGVNIPNDKRAVIALTYIYGIGVNISKKILKDLNLKEDIRIKDFSTEELNKIQKKLEDDYIIEGNLKRDRISNIKRLKEIRSYRGSRHIKNLTVRGQRTKTNSRTVRGNKRLTMGSGKTSATQKT